MRKNAPGIIISILLLFTACKKTSITTEENTNPISTNDQQTLRCEARIDAGRTAAASRITPALSPVVLLLDFNGQLVVNSAWSPGGTINCPAPSGSLLTPAMKDYIFQSITEDYSGFSVIVTKSESEYQAAAPARRMRCILTCNLAGQFGNIGGTAFIGSMLWGDNTPCFIFCDVLQYNQKYIAGAAAHELGHTFGLQHQSRYSPDCTMVEEYHSGFGSETLGWAPVMGLSYYQGMVTWHYGQTNIGCDQFQNDMNLLQSVAGAKADDYSATLNNNTVTLPSNGTKTGLLENAEDKDAFKKNDNESKRIKVTSNGNSDIVLEVYNLNGQLISSYDDVDSPNINVVINGKKYLKIRVSTNQPFVPAGDGFGGYIISVKNP
jgi:hypothetical protein